VNVSLKKIKHYSLSIDGLSKLSSKSFAKNILQKSDPNLIKPANEVSNIFIQYAIIY
jgi:hypothetical protein